LGFAVAVWIMARIAYLAFRNLEYPMQPISPAALIHRVGTALFGSKFQHDLAAALGVNRRTVARWVSGEIEPRAGVWSDLLRLIEARRVELSELVKVIAARVEPGER
jgi:transcriptional regulator with XRE-family HTH domain